MAEQASNRNFSEETDQYWTSRHKLFEDRGDDGEQIREAMKNYSTVWSIFAALLMTVSFSLLPVDTGSFYDDNDPDLNELISYLYVGLLLASTVFSFMAVLVGTFRYTFFDGLPKEMSKAAINAVVGMPGSQLFVYPAMVAQMLASTVGCYLFLGSGMLIMALAIFFFMFLPMFAWVWQTYSRSIASVGLNVGKSGLS